MKNKDLVKEFILKVRTGKELAYAFDCMNAIVIAHQVQSENEYQINRTPQDYISHVLEMKEEFGDFEIQIQEILADEDKVYVRWKQTGKIPTGRIVIELASAVYRIENSKICEYWIQVDRKGLELQQLI